MYDSGVVIYYCRAFIRLTTDATKRKRFWQKVTLQHFLRDATLDVWHHKGALEKLWR